MSLQELLTSIGQLSALQNLDLKNCSRLQELSTSIANWMHKPWFEILFEVARITYVYWAIECTSKLWFEVLFKLVRIVNMYWAIECTPKFWFEVLFEVTRITYVYWPIQCTLKPWFETLFKVARITYCLLVNWMYFKTFIC